jgi:hypothetical protein
MPSNNLTVARFVALKANIGSDAIEGDAPYVFSGTACRPASDGAESVRLSYPISCRHSSAPESPSTHIDSASSTSGRLSGVVVVFLE